jgi:hypothetical protein
LNRGTLLFDEAHKSCTDVAASEYTDAYDLALRFNRCHSLQAMGESLEKHRYLDRVVSRYSGNVEPY